MLPALYDRFQKSTNGFDKLLYAYYIFRVSARLLNERMMPEELFDAVLPPCMTEVRELVNFCFFPEITRSLDDFFGHFK